MAASTPVFAGTNMGDGGLSRNASVCTSTSTSSTRSLSSSRYSSVCTGMCLRPSTGSGVWRRACSLALRRASARLRASCSRCTSIGSGCDEAGSVLRAYVLPRMTRLSYMMLPYWLNSSALEHKQHV